MEPDYRFAMNSVMMEASFGVPVYWTLGLSCDKTIDLIIFVNRYLSMNDKRVRRAAERLLFNNIAESPLAADMLLSHIDKLSEDGALKTLKLLKNARPNKAAPIVIDLIRWKNKEISYEAADVIGMLGSSTDLPLLEEIRKRANDPVLERKLSHSSERILIYDKYYPRDDLTTDLALSSLSKTSHDLSDNTGELSYDESMRLINLADALLCHNDNRVRIEAEQVLFKHMSDSPLAAEMLLSHIDKLSEIGVLNALRVFIKAKYTIASPVVINLIRLKNRNISLEAAEVIGVLGNWTELPLLKDILKHANEPELVEKLRHSIKRIKHDERYTEKHRRKAMRKRMEERLKASSEQELLHLNEQMGPKLKEIFSSMTEKQKEIMIRKSKIEYGVTINSEGNIVGLLKKRRIFDVTKYV